MMDPSLSNSIPMDLLNATDSSPLLSHSVDPSHRTLSFSTCANLKCMCTFISVQSKFSVYGHTYANRQTYIYTSLPMHSHLCGARSNNCVNFDCSKKSNERLFVRVCWLTPIRAGLIRCIFIDNKTFCSIESLYITAGACSKHLTTTCNLCSVDQC